MGVEPIKLCSNAIEDIASVLASMVAGITEDIQLYVEKLFELQANTGTLGVINRLWVMNLAHGSIPRDKM